MSSPERPTSFGIGTRKPSRSDHLEIRPETPMAGIRPGFDVHGCAGLCDVQRILHSLDLLQDLSV